MQGWMIALIIVAGVIAVLAIAFLVGSLMAVHIILGVRKPMSARKMAKHGYSLENYGIDVKWFDEIADGSSDLDITAFDGVPLRAVLIKHEQPSDKVAVLLHGYCATVRSTQPQAKYFYDKGFDVLLPAMRGHGVSGGKVGMAWLDRFDALRWLDKVVELYGKDVSIAMLGVSMGGATTVAAAGMDPPPQLKCIIDDCGFSSQYDEYASLVKCPAITLLPLVVGVKLVHGYSLYDADIVPLAANIKIPALFIHGEKDKFVPAALGKKLYAACGSPVKELAIFPEAAHALSYVVDPERYLGELDKLITPIFGEKTEEGE